MPKVVQSVTFFINSNYTETTFDSCDEVTQSSLGIPAISAMCGPWGAYDCNAERWFDYMGDVSNSFAPFQINYEYTTEEMVDVYDVYNPDVYKCDQSRPGFVSTFD